MTPEERAEFEAFRAEKEKKAAEVARKQARVEYAELVDAEVNKAVEELESLSQQIKATKEKVYNNFSTVLDMKSEVIGIPKDNQRSHTFTTSDSRCRIILGVHTVDGYRDTVEDGITMVKETTSKAWQETKPRRHLYRQSSDFWHVMQLDKSKPLECFNSARWRTKSAMRNSAKVYASSRRVTNPQ